MHAGLEQARLLVPTQLNSSKVKGQMRRSASLLQALTFTLFLLSPTTGEREEGVLEASLMSLWTREECGQFPFYIKKETELRHAAFKE